MMKPGGHSTTDAVAIRRSLLAVALSLVVGCGGEEKSRVASEKAPPPAEAAAVTPSELQKPVLDTIRQPDFAGTVRSRPLEAYYDDPEFKEYYRHPVPPPAFDFDVDCSEKSLAELRCLRNEMFARNGYLFKDAILRGYFNQFPWYQPIYWDSTFTVSLNDQERWFVNKMVRLEQQHIARNYVKNASGVCAHTANIINTVQFDSIPGRIMDHLDSSGLAVVMRNHRQLFHVYDQNLYQSIPPFVTTDLYLQVLHLYYSNLMKNLEKDSLFVLYDEWLGNLYTKTFALARDHGGDQTVRQAAAFATTFHAIPLSILRNERMPVPEEMQSSYDTEIRQARSQKGMGSPFLGYRFFDYTQLKPRGHYAEDTLLTRYFGAVKWLLTAPYLVDDDRSLRAAVLSAAILTRDARATFDRISAFVDFLVGKPDNPTIIELAEIIDEQYRSVPLAKLCETATLQAIRNELKSKDTEQITGRGGSADIEAAIRQTKLFTMAGAYTFDAEILQRMIHLERNPMPLRPHPKALDVFAVLGNETAERILLDDYAEAESWPGYDDTLRVLQKKFSSGYSSGNAYTKRISLLEMLLETKDGYPYFMKSSDWRIKSLTTALAGYAQLKHEVVLYAKQAFGAQCGEGGGPPPPMLVGYVEPNTDFWRGATELLALTRQNLTKQGLYSEFARLETHLSEVASFLLGVSEKQLAGTPVTDSEYRRLAWIGGEIEDLTLRILKAYEWGGLNNVDREIGLATDVYTYNTSYLEEAVGYAHELYVVVEIEGLLYLTRGAVLSYYEFMHSTRLTDREWQAMLEAGDAPEAPTWTDRIKAGSVSPKTKDSYTYLVGGGGCM